MSTSPSPHSTPVPNAVRHEIAQDLLDEAASLHHIAGRLHAVGYYNAADQILAISMMVLIIARRYQVPV